MTRIRNVIICTILLTLAAQLLFVAAINLKYDAAMIISLAGVEIFLNNATSQPSEFVQDQHSRGVIVGEKKIDSFCFKYRSGTTGSRSAGTGGLIWRYFVTISVPLWIALIVTGIIPAHIGSRYMIKKRRRKRENECSNCGYNLTGNTSGVCSECGTRIEVKSTTDSSG